MQEQPRENFNAGLGFVLMATLGWSLSGFFVRLMPELNGFQINCWRGYWMAVALLVYLVLAYGKDLPRKYHGIPRAAFVSSMLCFAFGTTAYVSALTFTTTATVSVIGATSPLIAGLLSPWLTREKPSTYIWVAAAMALAGAAYIFYGAVQADGAAADSNIAGVLISFLVPITFAIQTMLLRRYRDVDLMPAICAGGFFAFFACGVLGFIFTGVSGFAVDMKSMGLLMLMGPFQLAIPLIFYGMGARHVSAATLTVLSMLDAVLNPLWPLVILGEVPGPYAIGGGAIILGAVLLSIFGGHLYANSRRLSTR